MEHDDLQDFDAAAKSVHSSVLIQTATMTRPGTAVNRSGLVSSLRSTSASLRRPSSAILGPNQNAASCVKAKAAVRLTQITVPTSHDIRSTIFPSSPAPFIESKLHVGIANMQPNIQRPHSAARDESLETIASTIKFVDLCRENDAAGMNPDNLTTPFTRCSRTQLKPALPRPGYVVAPAKMKIVVDLEKAIAVACTSGQGCLHSTEEQLDETKLDRSRAFLKVLKTLEGSMPKLETVLSPIAAELEDFFGRSPTPCSTTTRAHTRNLTPCPPFSPRLSGAEVRSAKTAYKTSGGAAGCCQIKCCWNHKIASAFGRGGAHEGDAAAQLGVEHSRDDIK